MRIPIVRLIAAVTAALLPVVVMPAPAQAADIPITSRNGTTDGNPSIHVATTSCMIPNPTDVALPGSVDRTLAPPAAPGDEVPPGQGVLRVQQGNQANLLSGVSFDPRPMSELTVFRTLIRFPNPSRVYAVIKLVQSNTSWVAVAEPPSTLNADNWHPFNAMTPNYFWIEQPGGLNREEPAMTIAAFRAKYGADGQATGFIGAGPCDGFTPTTVYADDFRVSHGTDTQVFDFEVPFAATMSIAASPQTITYGSRSTLSTTLRRGTTALPSRQVTLYRTTSGDPVVVGTATTDANGVARKAVAPARNTTYFWYFAGDANHSISWTPGRIVYVRARVTLSLADSTLRPGQTLVATGRVSPAKVGSVATLWRKTNTGRVKLRSITLTKADGTFRITKVLNNRGTYRVYVTVPAATGNLAGTSPIRTATVS